MSKLYSFLNETIKSNTLSEKDINLTDNLRDDLGLDSLGILAVADEVEEKFDIALEAEDLANTPATVEGLLKLIESKMG
jgi:acyl carrier protein